MSCHYNLLFLKASIYNAVSSSAPQLLMINRPTTRSKVSSGGTIPSEVDVIYVPSVSSKYIKYDNNL